MMLSTIQIVILLGAAVVLAVTIAALVYRRNRPPDIRRLRARQDVAGLARALQHGDAGVRAAAAEALGRLGTARAVGQLGAALRDADAGVSVAAATALGQLSGHLTPTALGVGVLSPLIAALRDPRAPVAVAAVTALGDVGAPAVTALLAALNDTRVDVHIAAAAALGRIRDARAVLPLARALHDERPDVSATAAAALSSIGAPAVAAMLPILREARWPVRRRAAIVLGQIGDPHGVEPLISALLDRSWDVRRASAEALRRIGVPSVGPLIRALQRPEETVRAAASAGLAEVGEPAVEPLSALMRDRAYGRGVRRAAAETLEAIGLPLDPTTQAWCAVVRSDWERAVSLGSAAVEPLGDELRDRDAAVRRAAAAALARIGVPSDPWTQAWHAVAECDWSRAALLGAAAVEPLRIVLHDPDPEVRSGAAVALGQVGAQLDGAPARAQVVEALLAALADKVRAVCQAAAEGLGWIGAHTVEPLIAILGDHARDTDVREAAAGALGRTRHDRAVEPLLAALNDEKWRVRVAAAEALGLLGEMALAELLAALTDERWHVRWAAARALGRAGHERVVEPLCAALRDEDKYVRWAAAEALDQLGVPPSPAAEPWYAAARRDWARATALGGAAVAPLVVALRDPDRGVRDAATNALTAIGAPAVEPLVAAVQDHDALVRESAAAALGRAGDTRAVTSLILALKDDTAAVRRAASRALGRIADSRAVTPLVAGLKDPDPDVRRTAAEALGDIGDAAMGPLLGALLSARDDSRWVIAAALGQTGDARAVEVLLVALQDTKAPVRRAAVEALGSVQDARVIAPLLSALVDRDGTVREAACHALVAVGARAVDPLLLELEDDQDSVRQAAAEALGSICAQEQDAGLHARVAARLSRSLEHDDSEAVRRVAAAALAAMGVPAVELLAASLEDRDRDVRRTAAEALERIGLPADPGTQIRYAVTTGDWMQAATLGGGAVDALLVAFQDEEQMLRQAAVDTLTHIGAPAVEPLLAALQAGSPVAAEALGRIGDARAVEPLMGALEGSRGLREAAASALMDLYRHGGLDEQTRYRILALREKMGAAGQPDASS